MGYQRSIEHKEIADAEMIDETRRRKEWEEEREREREGGRGKEWKEEIKREREREREGKKGRIRVGDEKEGMVKCRGTRMSKKKN